MKNKVLLVMTAAMISLAGCGGGGGGTSTPSTPVVTTPAPTISLTLSKPKVSLGSSSTVTWSSTNATTCTASGAWSGTQVISGTSAQTPTASGTSTYTLTCTGAGGSSNQSVALIVPIPVQKTSYLNAKNLNIPSQKVPDIKSTNGDFERITGGLAFGDFFQTGELSMVAFSNLGHYYNATTGTVPEQGKIYFFKNVNGQWVDRTTDLLKDNAGCISPRKLLVADFNNDGIPDVYSVCHGSEVGAGNTWTGENQRVLLSQPDGTYKNVKLDLVCYCHGGSAADVDSNGTIDIVTSDGLLGRDRKYAYMRLIGDGRGNFTIDRTPFMAPVAEGETVDSINYFFSAFHIELIDMNNDGKLDMFVSGSENYMHTYILSGDGKGRFDTVIKQFPKASNEAHVTDMVFVDGLMYEHLYINNSPLVQVRKFAKDFSSYEVIYSKEGQDFVWFMPFNNMLVAYDSAYGFAINK